MGNSRLVFGTSLLPHDVYYNRNHHTAVHIPTALVLMPESHTKHGEQLVMLTNEHWIKLVTPVTVAALLLTVSMLLFVLAGITAHHYMWLSHLSLVVAMIVFLIAHHWFFMMLLSEELDRIIITNKRLIRLKYRLIIQEDILEVSFEKMKTVDAVKKGILQNFLHYGTLVFESKLASVQFVPHPNRVAKVIQEAMMQK
jgi:hypothetical protein